MIGDVQGQIVEEILEIRHVLYNKTVELLTCCVIVYSGERRVHHGVQQISALPARHTRRTHPQILGGYRTAASKEEQVEELNSLFSHHPQPRLYTKTRFCFPLAV